MRRLLVLVAMCVAGLALPLGTALAAPEPAGPVVDVVEIAGVIDRPIVRYAMEAIADAERHGAALLVFEVDSLGALKISDAQILPPFVRRIRDARIPIAVHIGPRGARAAGVVVYMAAAAHISSIGLSAHLGAPQPIDLARAGSASVADEERALEDLARARGRTLRIPGDTARAILAGQPPLGANAARDAGFVDLVVPSVAELLRRADGRTVTTAAGTVTLRLPPSTTTVRFLQPGPIRRFLHAFSNPTLVFVMLIAGALLIVFELFQPGFGVAGVTGGLFVFAAGFGLTTLPARAWSLGILAAGLGLLTVDVAIDSLGPPTIVGTAGLVVGSLYLFPTTSEVVGLSPWLIGSVAVVALIVFVPVMTVVRRARKPIATAVRTQLIGEEGEVRSMLNPEGFVAVEGEIWRARSGDGRRMRVGESITVTAVDGTVLIVAAPSSTV